MPKCNKCGRNYCYAKNDLTAGRIKHPEICYFCSLKLDAKELKQGEREKVGKSNRFFKADGGTKADQETEGSEE